MPNLIINPEQSFTKLKNPVQLKGQQSSPIPQHKRLSNHDLLSQNLQMSSSSVLNPQQKDQFNIRNYRFNQSYFSKEDLLEQQNYSQIINEEMIYCGGIKNDLKHGWGVLLTKNIVYEGLFSLNHKNGKGFIEYSNKSRYFGDFVNDKPHGQGMLEYGNEYYIGDFENGMMDGDGLWKNQKGEKYVGKWKNNKAHGYGVYSTENSHYQGQFNTFEKHGYGIENFTNGDIYKGNYMHGKPHGYGEYIWQNKIQYKGNFIKGLRQGEGVWVNEIGDQYEGFFKDDKKNGHGIYKWANGNVYQGQFLDDMRHGNGYMVWNDGSTYEGEWARGLPHGKGLYKTKGQKPKYGVFEDNVLIQQLKSFSVHKHKNNHHEQNNNSIYGLQKSKLYLNIIPEYPKKRNVPQSRSISRRAASLHKTAGTTMGTFKFSTAKNSLSWRNK